MKSRSELSNVNSGRASSVSRSLGNQAKALVDNRPQLIAQRKLQQDIASKVGSPVQFRSRTPLRSQALARNEQGGQRPVLQAIFTYKLNPFNFEIEDARYDRRNGGNRFLTGNAEYKHITADTVKAKMFDGFNGKQLDVFADAILSIAESYQSMPSLKLLSFHKLHGMDDKKIESLTDKELKDMGLNGNMSANFLLLRQTIAALPGHKTSVENAKDAFKAATDADKRKARALELDYVTKKMLDDLDVIRDGMPLVNIISGIQSRGKEPEARKFLDSGIPTGEVKSDLTALWAFFDTAAIEQLTSSGSSSKEMKEAFQDSFGWVDYKKLEANGKIKQKYFHDYFAAHMIANHITLVEHSYPGIADSSGLVKPSSLRYLLEKAQAGVDIKQVIGLLGSLVDLEEEEEDEAAYNYESLKTPATTKKGKKRKAGDDADDAYMSAADKRDAKKSKSDAKKKVAGSGRGRGRGRGRGAVASTSRGTRAVASTSGGKGRGRGRGRGGLY